MAETKTWQESVLQVFYDLDRDLDSEAKGKSWKYFLFKHDFEFDWGVIEAEGVWAPAAIEVFAKHNHIDRHADKLRDLVRDMPSKVKWIFPGRPAQSVLYHLLASADAAPDLPPPTQAQIETVENAVYAAQNFTLADVYDYAAQLLPSRDKNPAAPDLRVVVFACEYRAASAAPHGLHADMCYSRTGVARVGTVSLPYKECLRSYPFTDTQDHFQIPVLPARYALFLAAPYAGSAAILGRHVQKKDKKLKFWIPVHKLFPGTQCLRDIEIQLAWEAHHVNEKLRRFHLHMQSKNIDTNWNTPDIDNPPFTFTQGIANLGADTGLGSREVVPVPRKRLIEPAAYKGRLLTYWVPPFPNGVTGASSSSLTVFASGGQPGSDNEYHPAPNILNARHRLRGRRSLENLNKDPKVVERLKAGEYQALHFIDYTGDGWVTARVRLSNLDGTPIPRQQQELLFPGDSPPCAAAYSLVAAPDFLPKAGQRAVKELFEAQVPPHLRLNFWDELPDSLADQRNAPNLTLNKSRLTRTRMGAQFTSEDKTMTAIVTQPAAPVPGPPKHGEQRQRRSILPDTAAGVFAPGWDVGLDITEDEVPHLAMYSLGSPFVTDAKLCCALNAFWPAASPDTARKYEPEPGRITVVPLLDHEIGMHGGIPWDGVAAPQIDEAAGTVEYPTASQADYVEPFLRFPRGMWAAGVFKSPFYLKDLAEIDSAEYVRRLLAMFRAYKAFGVPVDQPPSDTALRQGKSKWGVLFFRRADPTDAHFQAAQNSQAHLAAQPFFSHKEIVYYCEAYQREDNLQPSPTDARRVVVQIATEKTAGRQQIRRRCFVGQSDVLIQDVQTGGWVVAPRVAGL